MRPAPSVCYSLGMTQTKSIAVGDRIYATETISYDYVTDPTPNDGVVEAGAEGVVIELTGDDANDLYVEWDLGFTGTCSSASVALVD